MIGEAIQSDTLKALVAQHAIQESVLCRLCGSHVPHLTGFSVEL